MIDIFDTKILCRKCNIEMNPEIIRKGGFEFRTVKCMKCGERVVHPADMNGFEHFNNLKGKTFSVKLRMVGNSHAISIPKEIVDFINEMNHHSQKIDEMVRLCFEDFGRLSVRFGGAEDER